MGDFTPKDLIPGHYTYRKLIKDPREQEKRDTRERSQAATRDAKALEDAKNQSKAKAEEAAREETRKRLANVTQTIFTSPLGVQNDKLGI